MDIQTPPTTEQTRELLLKLLNMRYSNLLGYWYGRQQIPNHIMDQMVMGFRLVSIMEIRMKNLAAVWNTAGSPAYKTCSEQLLNIFEDIKKDYGPRKVDEVSNMPQQQPKGTRRN